jgi:hypothetical protein
MSACTGSTHIQTFNLLVSDEEPYIKQENYSSDSLIIDSTRVVQIVNNDIFIDCLQMDSYVFHISEMQSMNDSLISFSIDKEGSYMDWENGRKQEWTEIHSKEWYHHISIARYPQTKIWLLKYDNRVQGKLIRDRDIIQSGYPILDNER